MEYSVHDDASKFCNRFRSGRIDDLGHGRDVCLLAEMVIKHDVSATLCADTFQYWHCRDLTSSSFVSLISNPIALRISSPLSDGSKMFMYTSYFSFLSLKAFDMWFCASRMFRLLIPERDRDDRVVWLKRRFINICCITSCWIMFFISVICFVIFILAPLSTWMKVIT